VLLALGVGIISLMLQIDRHLQSQMTNNIKGIDMVVGAKGSPLQLILSAVFQIDVPTGNISLNEAETLQENRLVEFGIPLSYGDSYEYLMGIVMRVFVSWALPRSIRNSMPQ